MPLIVRNLHDGFTVSLKVFNSFDPSDNKQFILRETQRSHSNTHVGP